MQKSRAILLGTNAFPYLINYWYESFLNFQDEVDRLYIVLSHAEHPSAWDSLKRKFRKNRKVSVIESNRGWPESVNHGLRQVGEDLVFIPHDDTIIYEKGVLSRYFEEAEKGKVATPSKTIYGPKDRIEELIKAKYQAEPMSEGFSFYCNFFFAPMEIMRKTRGDFGAFNVPKGEYCKELDVIADDNFVSDTNFLLALDLIDQGVSFHEIENQELPYCLHDKNPSLYMKNFALERQGTFKREAGWVHLGTIAYHIHTLFHDLGKGKYPRIEDNPELVGDRNGTLTIAARIAWIKEFADLAPLPSELDDYNLHAMESLEYVKQYLGIKDEDINNFREAFHFLLKGEL